MDGDAFSAAVLEKLPLADAISLMLSEDATIPKAILAERKEIDDLKTLTLVLMLRTRHPDLFGEMEEQ